MNQEQTYKECDLVMKGGITSGVVYPRLVLKLKDKYRFRSIGGTSAGAIAAAATAAAEYGRDVKDSDGKGGFEKLDALKNQLAKETFLRDLFQPSQEIRPLMNVLLYFLEMWKGTEPQSPSESEDSGGNAGMRAEEIDPAIQQRPSTWQVILGLTGTLLRHTPFIFIAGALLSVVLTYLLVALVDGSLSGWRIIFPIVVAWFGGLLASAVYLFLIFTQKVPKNMLGICTGRKDNSEKEDLTVLTDWLNDRLNDLAGIREREKPLTFGDLRCKKFGDLRDKKEKREDNITLRMISSNLSQNQPYVLPFKQSQKERQLFIFNKHDFAKLFPKQVLDYLLELNLVEFKKGEVTVAKLPSGYYFLPEADDLPVIVATRMSLSFPILLSAVRLYTIKPEKALVLEESSQPPKELTVDDLQINWFSDGGICSNFPIHFFDSWLPTRPTFGVNLTSMPENQLKRKNGQAKVKLDFLSFTSPQISFTPEQITPQLNADAIYLPKADAPLATEFIPLENDLIKSGEVPVPNLLRFFGSIFSTAQNYRDNAQSVLPSYRERIVQIRLSKDEGGLNLAMPKDTIENVINKGAEAGDVLLNNFEMTIHQWVRFRVLMKQMEASINKMNEVITNPGTYRDLVDRKLDPTKYPFYPDPCEVEWLSQVAERLKGIGDQVKCWNPPELFDKEPSPLPEPVLRVMPPV